MLKYFIETNVEKTITNLINTINIFLQLYAFFFLFEGKKHTQCEGKFTQENPDIYIF